MPPSRSIRAVLRTAAVLCCLSAVVVASQDGSQGGNQGIYRRCADGRTVAVPCLQPSTDCTDRSVPSRIPGSCVRWYSCCKEPPKDVSYIRPPEEKAVRREEMYQKAFSWLVAGARAIKNMWNSVLDRVRGGTESEQQQQPQYGSLGPVSEEVQNWRGPPYGENGRPSRSTYRSRDSQRPSSLYGPPRKYRSPQIGNLLTDSNGVLGRYGRPGVGKLPRRGRGPLVRPVWSQTQDDFTGPNDSEFPSQPTSPTQFQPSGSVSGFLNRLPPPPPSKDSTTERSLFLAPASSLQGADAIVAEAARRWLPRDCGRPSPIRSPTVPLSRRRRDITGGHPADRSRWPWMAIIGARQPGENWAENRGQGPVWICGGAVITRRFILTAAHCVAGRAADRLVVRLGEYNLSSVSDGPHQDRQVSGVTLHPQYVSRQNDVALLRLSSPAELGLTVRPVCLPVPGAPTPADGARRVAGWGKLSFAGAGAAVLQEAKLTLVPSEVCEAIYRRLSSFAESFPGGGFLGTKLCAVDPSSLGADACQGDSGGPLTAPRPDGRVSLAGIVSLGVGCGDPAFPGVYTRVESYVPWIVAEVAKAEARRSSGRRL